MKLGLLGPHVLCLSAIPQDDAETVVGLAQDLEPLKGTKEESLDGALLRTIALSSAGTLSPMAAILGGVAAQEVLKVGTCWGREELAKWAGQCIYQWAPVPSSSPGACYQPSCIPQKGSQGSRNWELAEALRVMYPPLGSLQKVHAPGPMAVL